MLSIEQYSIDNNMVSKFELESLLLIFIYVISKFKVTYKNGKLECLHFRIYSKENHQKFLTLHSPFCSILIKILLTQLPYWVLWNLLFLMKPSSCSKFILAQRRQSLEFVNLKYITFTQPIWGPLKSQK